LEEQAVRLAQQTALLQETLGSLAQTFSDNLKDELSNISQVTRSRRYVEVVTFFVVVISALIVTAVFLKRSILTPLKHLTGIASKIAVGDLSGRVDLHSKDELGMVANAFREMIAYIRDVAQIAQRVAVGEIDVQVKPKSSHDVLNLAFAETIQYIQNVANIAEKISRKELQVIVTPKSDQDVLNLSFQRMVTNLQEMMEEIHTSMMSVQQLNWIRTGQAELNTRIRGEQDIETLAQNTITYLATYLNAQIGAIYLISDNFSRLTLVGSYAYANQKEDRKNIPIGVGLVGQAALEKQRIVFDDVPDNYIRINSDWAKCLRNISWLLHFFTNNS
jgi:methyl-accepting chemotaxis protein